MIKIKNFEEMTKQAERKINSRDIETMKNTINTIFMSIKDTIYSHGNKLEEKSNEEINDIAYKAEQAIQQVLKDCLIKVSYNIPTEGEAHTLNAYQCLLYDHQRRKDIYNKIKDIETNKLNKGYLGNNIEKNQEFLMKQVLAIYREITDTITEKEYYVLERYKRSDDVKRIARETLPEADMERLDARSKMIGKESEKIEEAFLGSRDIFSDNIRRKYITALRVIGKIIKDFGLFKIYEQRESARINDIGIEEENINLEEYFNKEFLETLPIKTLIAMNVFWENRLTKEIQRINNGIFIMQDLNLIEQILKDDKKYEKFPFDKLPDDTIEAELIKTEILNEISQICIDDMEKAMKGKKQEKFVEKIDMDPYVKGVSPQYQAQYNKYFSKKIPNTLNILDYDLLDKYLTGKNIVNNLYIGKNANVLALIESCITRDTIQNWGYIEEENDVGNFIILGFDIEGLNMPLRIHIPKDYLKEFLEANEMENIIPIYKGNEDFRKLGNLIKTPVLIPMNPNIKKQIQDMQINRKGSIQQAMYIEHLKYLADASKENFPQRLKTPKVIGKGKKQKVKYSIKREYINIDTKQKYDIDKDGKYIPIPEKEAR